MIRAWLVRRLDLLPVLFLGAAVAAGVYVRVQPVLQSEFPLNDGGLFSVMIRQIQAADYALPFKVAYNGTQIPFAYPPLALYLAAAISDLTRTDVIQVLRVVPAILTLLTLGAFYLLARSVIQWKPALAAAMLFFALLPGSYVWQLMGGGITRALGLLMSLLALHQAYRFYTRGSWFAWVLMVVFSAATILAHTEWALFLAVSILSLFLWQGKDRRAILMSILAGVIVLIATAPWWATAFGRYGLAPFFAASESGSWLSLLFSEPGESPSLVLVAAIVAAVAAIPLRAAQDDRQLFVVGWIGLITLVDFRAYAQLISVPAALGAGYAAAALVAWIIRRAARTSRAARGDQDEEPRVSHGPREVFTRRAVLCIALIAIGCGLFANVAFAGVARRGLVALSPDERAPMSWAAAETPVTSKFLIVSGVGWAIDRVSEWFPVLAERESITTVQGSEWLPGVFSRRQEAFAEGNRCGGRDITCLQQWQDPTGLSFSHVYLVKTENPSCCTALRAALEKDPSYALVFDGPAATVFARRAPS